MAGIAPSRDETQCTGRVGIIDIRRNRKDLLALFERMARCQKRTAALRRFHHQHSLAQSCQQALIDIRKSTLPRTGTDGSNSVSTTPPVARICLRIGALCGG